MKRRQDLKRAHGGEGGTEGVDVVIGDGGALTRSFLSLSLPQLLILNFHGSFLSVYV